MDGQYHLDHHCNNQGGKELLGKYDINPADNLKTRKLLTQYNILESIIIFIIIVIATAITHMLFDDVRNIGISLFASSGESSPLWDKRVNVLQINDAKEQTVEIRALMSAISSPEAWDLRVYVREKLIEFIQREYPQCLPRTRGVVKEEGK